MIKTGFIKKIGEPRDWQTKEGEKRQTYPVTVAELMESQAELDLTISFSLHEYNGKEYTNIKLLNLSRKIN